MPTNCYLTFEYPYEIALNTTTDVQLCRVQQDTIVWCQPFQGRYLDRDIRYLIYSETPYGVVSITWTKHFTESERHVVRDLLRVNSKFKVPMYAVDFPQPPPLKKIQKNLDEWYTSGLHEVFEEELKEVGIISDIHEYYKDLIFEGSAPRCPILNEKDSLQYFPRVKFDRLTLGGALYRSQPLEPTLLPEDHFVTVVELPKIRRNSVFDSTDLKFQKNSDRCSSMGVFLQEDCQVKGSPLRFVDNVHFTTISLWNNKPGSRVLVYIPLGCKLKLVEITRNFNHLSYFQQSQVLSHQDEPLELEDVPEWLEEEEGTVSKPRLLYILLATISNFKF